MDTSDETKVFTIPTLVQLFQNISQNVEFFFASEKLDITMKRIETNSISY